jgi:ribokinase
MKRIVVVGSMNMDMVVRADRIPKPGETLYGQDIKFYPGGKGANQAVAAAKLGGMVKMFGCVGKDDWGNQILDAMFSANVDASCVKVLSNVSTGMTFITVGGGDNTILLNSGANECVDISYIDSIKRELLEADMILLQNEIPQETNEYVVSFAHAHNKTVILNPAPAREFPSELLSKVTYLTPNEHEAALLFGDHLPVEDILKSAPEKVIVTLGSSGVAFCTSAKEIVQIPALQVNVVDTTGAGDTLNGALAFKLAQGSNLEDAVKFANVAAGCSIEALGAQSGMPSYQQVIDRSHAYL